MFVVSSIHKGGNIVKRNKKRPRVTQLNKNHVSKIWGDSGKKEVYIPSLIDDYNHWMGGVDLSDQRIAYYHPNIKCQRNWIPMFIQVLKIIRVNAYIVHNEYYKKDSCGHKRFTLEMVKHLMGKAFEKHLPSFRSPKRTQPSISPPSSSNKRPCLHPTPKDRKRQKVSVDTLEALVEKYPQRKQQPCMHIRMKSPIQGSCIVCAMYFAKKKKDNPERSVSWDKEVKRTAFVCAVCSDTTNKCFLCKEHFTAFHDAP